MDTKVRQISRKSFLKAAGAAILVPWLPRISPSKAAALDLSEIAPGIFVHKGPHALVSPENVGDICNRSFIVGKNSVAVIDTGGSARTGTAFKDAIRSVTDKPISHVINTHMHPDHVFGNASFEAEKPAFVAHHKLAAGLGARAEFYIAANKRLLGEEAFSGTKIVMPNQGVTDKLEIDLGDRKLSLVARPTAHTDNDLTVLDTASGTLFMGDLLFSEHIPTLDGSIAGWIKLTEVLRNEQVARAVPGHGPVSMSWPDALLPLDRYLRRIAEDVRSMIKAGKPIEEAIKSAGQDEKANWLLADEHHVRNVTAAYAELEWE